MGEGLGGGARQAVKVGGQAVGEGGDVGEGLALYLAYGNLHRQVVGAR